MTGPTTDRGVLYRDHVARVVALASDLTDDELSPTCTSPCRTD